MRKILVLSFLFLGGLFITGCADENNQLEPSDYDEVDNLNGVEFTALEDSVSPIGLTAHFENNTDTEFTFGEAYILETYVENNWYKVSIETEEDYGFIDIGYILPPNGTAEWAVDWEWLYGKLEPGSYRVVKDVLDVYEGGGYDAYSLAAEFEIQ